MMVADREALADTLGYGILQSTLMTAEMNRVCITALPYLCGAALASLSLLVAQGRFPDRVVTDEEKLEAMRAIIMYAEERLMGAREHDLDTMPVEGNG